MANKTFIVWDLGATKCAAAVMHYDQTTQAFTCLKHCHIKLTQVDNLEALIKYIENALDYKMADADAICIGAAGMFDGNHLHLAAGYPYPMTLGESARRHKWHHYEIIHDYAPIVCGTFICNIDDEQHIKRLNQAKMDLHGRRVTLGVGTGLGVKDGVLLSEGNFWLGSNEMGHIGIAQPVHASREIQQRHTDLLHFLNSYSTHHQNIPLSFETLLSGKGTLRLHQFLHPDTSLTSPEEVGELMRKKEGRDILALFAWYLGLFVSTVQLSFMPSGGIWMTGGVIQQHPDVFNQSDFLAGINACPAYLSQRQTFPLYLIRDPLHAFKGAAYYAAKRLIA